jgi:hypothetical protein
MQISVSKYRDWVSLPEILHAEMQHHCVQTSFEELFMASSQRSEPSYEWLYTWCEQNCTGIFSTKRLSHDTHAWYFYVRRDLNYFLSTWRPLATKQIAPGAP